ncbi:hypothetical protein HD806DRAFT_508663 [Xylariaceae sp. AK1471]|nr:hypothetical protein HD806DRAFT_508663 [Xylariaceae sp. AK1471]
MTDHNASSLSRRNAPNSPNAATRSLGRSSISQSSGTYITYDAGESSTAASLAYDTSIDGTTFGRSSPHSPREPSPDLRSAEHGEHNPSNDARRRHLSHKPRQSSGFLLPNRLLNENPKPGSKQRTDDRRKSRIPVDSRKGKSPLRSSEESNLLAPADPNNKGRGDAHNSRPHSQAANRRISRIPSLRPSSAPLDVDSTQIVSMALDLSESRRLASWRNVSTPIPPRLAQLPDSTPGGSLKQHLQQQRRSSRNISPRADRNLAPRIVSAPRISSPLQSAFDHDGSYTYHFSSSTLNRAQRAKEYLELMTQYRRLLVFLPPLRQEARSRPSTSNTPTSPSSISSPLDLLASSQNRTLGRPYNPLQYIRNRKIRTRERKTIDGEAQGFGDVPRVTDWIDEVATYAAASFMTESPNLPPYPAADECLGQLPASNLPRPVSASSKPKRQRLEWSIDPADMLADVYWLEQGNNRYLIEDRNYAKIFTPKAEVQQPITQSNEHNKSSLFAPTSKEYPDSNVQDIPEHDAAHPVKTDGETTLTSTRDRARQKLQDLRGMHHKHSNSTTHHEFLRFRRASSSDTSDNESDRRRRGRSGTISASGKDLLEKQMNEMLAKETQDEQKQALASGAETGYLKPLPSGLATPEKTSQVPRREHGRKDSHMEAHMEAVEHLDNALPNQRNQISPIHSGRTSLEVPSHNYRSSVDFESSRPVFSDTRSKGQHNGYIPAIGMDLSPSASRPSSPARTPFSKVKNMFRDRSRDREVREDDEKIINPIDPMGTFGLSAFTEDTIQPSERQRSKSSTREFTTNAIREHHKSHRSMGSITLRPDEQVGLRTILKGGAKLDDMIRGGVSKVTDLIWKRDSDTSSVTSNDDSDMEHWRGRPRKPALLSPESLVHYPESRRPVKNYLDIMPSFKSATDPMDKTASHEIHDSAQVVSQPPSRSPRFDQLKPPRIDVCRASPVSSDVEQSISRKFIDSDTSEIDSYSRDSSHPVSRPSQTPKALQNILSIRRSVSPKSHVEDRAYVSEHRHWTIPNRAALSQNTLISRREIARLRALILCSGIKAMEISRRANEPHAFFATDNKAAGLLWTDISRFALDEQISLSVPQTELFPTTARILSHSIDRSVKSFEKSASGFSTETAPALQQRVDAIHNRVAMDFMDMTRAAVDEADEVNYDIVDFQRLKVKSVVDTIDKMLRQRRRRFRWVRRAGWLAVEWVLVGFMWYVWFIVMIIRVIVGAGRGAASVVRWLFCL